MQPLSFQLYSARNFQPFTDIIAMLARIGYREIEGYGAAYGDLDALKAAMSTHRMTMPTAHFGIEALESDKAGSLEIIRALGVKTIVAPYLMPDDRPKDAAGWSDFGRRLEAIAKDYKSEGYRLAWHNHEFEFLKTAEGAYPQELIFNAAPSLLWEIDVAWVVKGGEDPVRWIMRHGHRIISVHLKDIAPAGQAGDEDGWADVGHGVMAWARINPVLKATPAKHWIVEHDNPKDVERFARRSFASALRF
jgi:sugar phosphate isomerase/epimerase